MNTKLNTSTINEYQYVEYSSIPELIGRLVDIVLSLGGILISLPVMTLVAFLISLNDKEHAIFKQQRVGRYGKVFDIYKFRTMQVNAEDILRSNQTLFEEYIANNYKLTIDEDSRITKIGKFLRRTSLDELPQLFNVLRGDMSLVGPRPVIPDELNEYGNDVNLLLSVKPGLTGYWQVCGRSDVNYPERANLEIHYVKNRSMAFDFKILFQTVFIVIQRKGAN